MAKKGVIVCCPVCSKEFYRYPSEERKRQTCSRSCAARMFRDKGTTKQCAHCAKDFWQPPSLARRGFGLYCSNACNGAATRKQIACTCVQCGSSFSVAPHRKKVANGGSFCSHTCRLTFRRKLRKRGEQEMFTNWQKREWKADKCIRCDAVDKLELDHITPRFAGGKAERNNAQTLCRTCNRKKFWTDDYPLYVAYLKQRAESVG